MSCGAGACFAAIPAAAPAASDPVGTFEIAKLHKFGSPWAMTFLPDGRLLVTEIAATLQLCKRPPTAPCNA